MKDDILKLMQCEVPINGRKPSTKGSYRGWSGWRRLHAALLLGAGLGIVAVWFTPLAACCLLQMAAAFQQQEPPVGSFDCLLLFPAFVGSTIRDKYVTRAN